MEKVKFDYDEENDSLFLYNPGEKPKGGVELGDFLVDLDMNLNKVVSLEILNASKILAVQLSRKITKESLKNIKSAVMRTRQKEDMLYVIYGIVAEYKNQRIEEETLIPIPIHVSS